MATHCQCGMTHEHHEARMGCRECGTTVCRSCSLGWDDQTYCRWCATTAAHGHVA